MTGLLLIDLDKFKEVNDTLGHACGDQLLAQVGPRLLAGALRENDVVARLSGDEFAVLLPELADVAAAVAVAERVLTALHAPFPVGDTTADVAASIGIAVAPEHGNSPTDLLRHADTAMYEAKEAAAGVAVYEPDRAQRAPTRFGLLGELRRALDRHELVVYYQPKVDVHTGALHGVEALVRWQHPERGLLQPMEFVPVAETTGLIHRLTSHVLDTALAQARAWLDAGIKVPVAVNLSTRCLHDSALPGRVMAALDRHGVPAHQLSLEITESAIMRDPAGALLVLRELAAGGVRLSLDDFGTGYSSMTYLRQLPVDELKVDKSFVSDLAAEQADAVLVRSAVDLGHNLGLSVVAEGVEDASTLSALQDLGCDVAQGYYVARPMPASEFDVWLSTSPFLHR
jgi:diguanylate cyclase (GGDEF)-like protein